MSDPIEAAREALVRRLHHGVARYDVECAIAAYHAAGGTVAVPAEPTEAMIRAGSQATLLLNDSDVRETYRAMIAVRQEEG